MKRIVVTGAKGGAGRSIVSVLHSAGYQTLGIDLRPVERDDSNYVQANLCTDRGLHDLLAGADGVVHFGSLPTDCETSATEAFHNLMLGGFHVFQACANLGIKRVVHASSITVYGQFLDRHDLTIPVSENLPPLPASIYGACKVALEQLASDMCRWHGLSIAAFRLSRIVYEGCFDWRLKRYTENPEAASDNFWTYVDARDVAHACLRWLESDVQGFHAFNVAADDVCVPQPVEELLRNYYPHVQKIQEKLVGSQSPFSCAKLKSKLQWQPQFTWRDLRDGR